MSLALWHERSPMRVAFFLFWLGLASLGGHALALHPLLARPLIRETSRLPAGAPNQRLTPLAKQPNCSSAAG